MLCSLFCLFECGITWVYPLSQTFADLRSKRFEAQWLSFWLIMGVLSYIEFNLLFFLADLCIYSFVKTIAVFWLVHPDYLGASYLHERHFLKVYEQVSKVLSQTPLRSLVN